MNLKSFGCSFIYGSELYDEVTNKVGPAPSQLTWPALYAKDLGYEYQCYARPGGGNLSIVDMVLNQLADNIPALYVIGWTWVGRFDYIDQETNKWKTMQPANESKEGEFYYKILNSEMHDKLTSLLYMRLVIDSLKQKNCPYIITSMDSSLLFEQRWHTTPAIIELQNYIKPHITSFDGLSFLEWSRSNGYPETAVWHPLEEAHRAAADYMINVFDTKNTIDPIQSVRV